MDTDGRSSGEVLPPSGFQHRIQLILLPKCIIFIIAIDSYDSFQNVGVIRPLDKHFGNEGLPHFHLISEDHNL